MDSSDRIQLVVGLRCCAAEFSPGRQRQELLALAEDLEQGQIPEAGSHGGPFSRSLHHLLASGFDSSRIPLVLMEYLRTARLSRTLWKAFWTGLFYPLTILTLSLIFALFFLVYISGRFRPIFSDFGVELPGMTQLVISLGQMLETAWIPLLAGTLVLIILIPLLAWRFTFEFLRWGEPVLTCLPWLGDAVVSVGISEFCALLAVLLEARMPLPDALLSLAKHLQVKSLRLASQEMATNLQSGMLPGAAARRAAHLPDALVALLTSEQNNEHFAEVLRWQSEIFATRGRIRVQQFVWILRPVTYLLICAVCVVVVIAMLMPLVKLLNDLS
jgi:type II secretory pathway component PulF